MRHGNTFTDIIACVVFMAVILVGMYVITWWHERQQRRGGS